MVKHTKGEWVIQFMDPDNKEKSDFWVKSFENEVTSYGTDIMADDYGEHVGYVREQRLADAKLIAAAPKMLKALKTILTIHRTDLTTLALKQAENAIKKATE